MHAHASGAKGHGVLFWGVRRLMGLSNGFSLPLPLVLVVGEVQVGPGIMIAAGLGHAELGRRSHIRLAGGLGVTVAQSRSLRVSGCQSRCSHSLSGTRQAAELPPQ
jgi:hypothetical protein